MINSRGLTEQQVVGFYDHFGAKQDKQAYYEDVALTEMVKHANLNKANTVVEFGCGTGLFAQTLLTDHLPAQSTYWGCDVSTTMLELTRKRIIPFENRASLWQSAGGVLLPLPNASADRFVSNYVLDILSVEEIKAVLREAQRILKKDGLLCLTGLTNGKGVFSKLWTAFWNVRFTLNPRWVGGCRPIIVRDYLEAGWEIEHYHVAVARGISSEVIVARKR